MDQNEIRRWFSTFVRPDALVEIRALSDNGAYSGYFDNVEDIIEKIALFDSWNLYYTVNEVKGDCRARSQYGCMVKGSRNSTSDNDIMYRWWLPIDVDAERTSGVSASDEEKERAHQLAGEVYNLLKAEGFSDPVVCDSSSGYHLLYPIALPNDDPAKETIKKFLEVLSAKVSNSRAHVDEVLFNAARILRLPGSYGRKGRSTEERPHRLCYIIKMPEELSRMDDVQMKLFIAKYEVRKAPVTDVPRGRFDIREFIRKHGIQVKSEKDANGLHHFVLEHCVFNPDHKSPDAEITISGTGVLGYNCFHNSCKHKNWRDVRLLFEPHAYDREWQLPKQKQQQQKPATTLDDIESAPQDDNDENQPEDFRNRFLSLGDIRKVDLSNMPKVESGFREIDRLIGGLFMTEVTVLSGTSSSGKSTWLNTLAMNVVNQGERVVMVNLEQTSLMLKGWIEMVAAGDSHVVPDIRRHNDDEPKYHISDETSRIIDQWLDGKFYLYDSDMDHQWVNLLRSMIAMAKEGVRFFILDNLMSIDMDTSAGDKWEQQKQVISLTKEFAKKYNCHCVLVAHPRKPQGFIRKHDISGTSDITNIADNVFIMHRTNRDFLTTGSQFYKREDIERFYNSLTNGNVMEIVKNRDYGVQDRLIPFIYSIKSRRFVCARWGRVDQLMKDASGKAVTQKVDGYMPNLIVYECEHRMPHQPDAPMNSYKETREAEILPFAAPTEEEAPF